MDITPAHKGNRLRTGYFIDRFKIRKYWKVRMPMPQPDFEMILHCNLRRPGSWFTHGEGLENMAVFIREPNTGLSRTMSAIHIPGNVKMGMATGYIMANKGTTLNLDFHFRVAGPAKPPVPVRPKEAADVISELVPDADSQQSTSAPTAVTEMDMTATAPSTEL
jgi:hypothetical protein